MEITKYLEQTDIFETFEYKTVKDKEGIDVEIVDESTRVRYSLEGINEKIEKAEANLVKLNEIKTAILAAK